MKQSSTAEQSVSLSVRNIGGISETNVEFGPGITVLSGRNATNRTSLLRSIMAALGSDDVSLKSDAEEGYVELQVGDETYTRQFRRENGTVHTSGDTYLEDPELADLFAFLLATNEAREAVLTGQDLRELIMRPVDTDAIEDEIARLEDQKDRIDQELDELTDLRQRLPDLEEKRRDIEDDIEATEAELESIREEIAAADAELDESRENDELLSDLGDVRSELESVRQELRAQRESLESLRDRRDELETEVEEFPESPEGRLEEIEAELEELREQKRTVQSEMNTLQRIIQFNEDTLEGASSDILDTLADGDGGNPTEDLLTGSTVVCWTCGHDVAHDDIEATLERLRALRQRKLGRSHDLEDRIDELETERASYEEKRRQRRQVTDQLAETRERLEERERRIADLEDRRDTLLDRVEELEERVETRRTQQTDDVLSLHREANRLEVELDRLEENRESLTRQIEDIRSELERREGLTDRREELTRELEDVRTRIDRIEADAVESFNEHMSTVLDALEYDNLERIWIEPRETETREGRHKVTRREFSLHIVRESDEGAYEDSLRHLSESEREVTGLVFALAGYLVHDVHERVPFMLLDSVEAIDSDRIATLVDYFEDYPDYLVAALLPEDAQAIDRQHHVVTDI